MSCIAEQTKLKRIQTALTASRGVSNWTVP